MNLGFPKRDASLPQSDLVHRQVVKLRVRRLKKVFIAASHRRVRRCDGTRGRNACRRISQSQHCCVWEVAAAGS